MVRGMFVDLNCKTPSSNILESNSLGKKPLLLLEEAEEVEVKGVVV